MKPKILIVDDEPDICRALEFLLKRKNIMSVLFIAAKMP